jgi:hypothetical protein
VRQLTVAGAVRVDAEQLIIDRAAEPVARDIDDPAVASGEGGVRRARDAERRNERYRRTCPQWPTGQ